MIISDCTWDGNLRRDRRNQDIQLFSSVSRRWNPTFENSGLNWSQCLGDFPEVNCQSLTMTPENWSHFFIHWKILTRKETAPSPVPPLHTRSRVTAKGSWAQQRFWCTWKGSQQNIGFSSVLSTFPHPLSSHRAGTEDARPVLLQLLTLGASHWQVERVAGEGSRMTRGQNSHG